MEGREWGWLGRRHDGRVSGRGGVRCGDRLGWVGRRSGRGHLGDGLGGHSCPGTLVGCGTWCLVPGGTWGRCRASPLQQLDCFGEQLFDAGWGVRQDNVQRVGWGGGALCMEEAPVAIINDDVVVLVGTLVDKPLVGLFLHRECSRGFEVLVHPLGYPANSSDKLCSGGLGTRLQHKPAFSWGLGNPVNPLQQVHL